MWKYFPYPKGLPYYIACQYSGFLAIKANGCTGKEGKIKKMPSSELKPN